MYLTSLTLSVGVYTKPDGSVGLFVVNSDGSKIELTATAIPAPAAPATTVAVSS